jgi:hypothetical protein
MATKTKNETLPAKIQQSVVEICDDDLTSSEALYTSNTLPGNVKDCCALIHTQMDALEMLGKRTTVRFWNIGRIVLHMRNVLKDPRSLSRAQLQTGYKRRALQYLVQLAERYPNYADIQLLSSNLQWHEVREMTRLDDPDNRKLMLRKVKDGELKSGDVIPMVRRLVVSEKAIQGGHDCGKLKPVSPKKKAAEMDPRQVNFEQVFDTARKELLALRRTLTKVRSEMSPAVALLSDEQRVSDAEYFRTWPALDKVSNVLQDIQNQVTAWVEYIQHECPEAPEPVVHD